MRLGLASLSVGDPRLWPTTVSRIWARRPRANASNGSICSSGVNAGQRQRGRGGAEAGLMFLCRGLGAALNSLGR